MKINSSNYEEWMIDYVEGNLSAEQQKELAEFMAFHPELQSELDAYQQTILQPDTHVVFANKEILKHEAAGRVITMPVWVKYSTAIAAVLMLFIGVRLYNNRDTQPVAIQKYEYQHTDSGLAIDRNTTEEKTQLEAPVKSSNNNIIKQAPQYAQNPVIKKDIHKKLDQRAADKVNEIRREQITITDRVEYAEAGTLKTDDEVQLADNLHPVHTSNNTVNTLKKDKEATNISLNDNNSVVDWWNDAMALGDEMGTVVEGILKYDIDPFKKPDPNAKEIVKTRSVNILGIDYYSRKKSNN